MRAFWIQPLLALTLVIPTGIFAAETPQPTATTMQGKVAGTWVKSNTQKAFLGIPYATPPVGDLRWKAPQPPSAWKGVRDATKYGNRCEQWHIWEDYIFQDAGPSEDCLFLNIYTPPTAKPGSKLPVMVWIHGGGFIAGSGDEPRYSNSALVAQNVILVTINYRLGVMGFLASEDLAKEQGGHAGNYGLMDQVAALRWVKANISAFGGNPSNVTIFGESAGSFAVSALSVAPSAQGLFHKMIGESGGFFGNARSASTADERGKRDQEWVDSLGVKNLAELRALPIDKILDAAKKRRGGGFSALIDGRFLLEPVAETYAAGKQAHVPSLIGWNRDERAGTLSKDMTVEKWKAYATEHYGAKADEFLAAFPGADQKQVTQSANDLTTAQFIGLGTWRWVEAQAKTGRAPVYRYRFDRPAPIERLHPYGYAFHSSELEFVFGTLDVRHGATWQPEDRKLSNEVVHYWTNFARSGDPNGPGLPVWPRYDTTKELIHLDSKITTSPDTARAKYEFVNENEARPSRP